MKITVCDGRAEISCSELAFFSRTKNSGGKFLRFSKMPFSGVYSGSGSLKRAMSSDGIEFDVVCTYDGLISRDGGWVLELVKHYRRVTSKVSPQSDARLLCEGALCAYMVACERSLQSVILRLTALDDEGKGAAFEYKFDIAMLTKMWNTVIARALPFVGIEIQRKTECREKLKKMPFPYAEIRGGQRNFINDTYHAAVTGTRLMVCAPTGIGKTVSALYPALRAVGAGHADKVFYLTAKTVTGNAAADAVRIMAKSAAGLRCVFISSKERTCPMKGGAGHGGCSRTCPMLGTVDAASYELRRDSAMAELLASGSVIDTAKIISAAEGYRVCPHELSLDISEYCDVVICDYNYIFDSNIRFRRYFDDVTEKYMFLIDEAHNLPDRAREMYSATVDSNVFLRLYKESGTLLDDFPPLKAALTSVIAELKKVAELCRAEERVQGDKTCGWYLSSDIPEQPASALANFCREAVKVTRSLPETAPALDAAFDTARAYVTAGLAADAKFIFFAETMNGRLKCSIRCLDPSEKLDQMMQSAHSTVLFSATFTPMDYFADILGCRDAIQLELDSPYDPERLCVVGVNSVSTRYSVRESYIEEIAEMIFSVIEAREGNYIAYFPSYEYMMQVYEAFSELAEGVNVIVQERGMSIIERNRFLSEFSEGRAETLIGFCVLGGAFAEGVDLAGERLIGTIIVGIGLPKITSEQNLLKDYFEETRENGYDYAFLYPSMIKVQQAAGRVIRGEGDRGVVVLLDDRYSEPAIIRLLPKNWRRIKFASDPYVLSEILERFWDKE